MSNLYVRCVTCPLCCTCHRAHATHPLFVASPLRVSFDSAVHAIAHTPPTLSTLLSLSHAASSRGRSHSYQPSVSPVDTKVLCHDRPPVHCRTWHVTHTQHQRVVGNWEVCHSFRQPECHRASIWGSQMGTLLSRGRAPGWEAIIASR